MALSRNEAMPTLHACRASGAGSVVFTTGTQYVFPEWWGAAANGRADDSTAVQKAYDAARMTGEEGEGGVGCNRAGRGVQEGGGKPWG